LGKLGIWLPRTISQARSTEVDRDEPRFPQVGQSIKEELSGHPNHAHKGLPANPLPRALQRLGGKVIRRDQRKSSSPPRPEISGPTRGHRMGDMTPGTSKAPSRETSQSRSQSQNGVVSPSLTPNFHTPLDGRSMMEGRSIRFRDERPPTPVERTGAGMASAEKE